MALEKLLIGARIKEIRENIFKEKRKDFAQRCGLTERHIGQIERGDFLLSLPTLDQIATNTGLDIDFILYGKSKNVNLSEREILDNLLEKADPDELKMYYKIITGIKSYISKNN